MRVTNSMMVSQLLLNVNRNLVKMSDQQDQLATGKKIRRPSDDPVLASKVIKYKTDIAEMGQYSTNARDALAWLDTTEVALKNAGEILGRTRDLAVQAANGTNTPEDTSKMAAEIENLRDSLIATGNTSFAGRYIFSSFETDKPLFNEDGSYNLDVGKYTLDNKPVSEFEISMGEKINVMTHGIDIFGTQLTDNIVTQNIVNTFDTIGLENTEATVSSMVGPIDLNVDMTNPPTNIVNITIGDDTFEMDVAGLDGTVAPIDKNVFLARVNGAVTNPAGISIGTVANIFLDSDDDLVIESKIPGPLVMTEGINGYGTNGVDTREAILNDPLVLITDADIVANAAAILAKTFTFEVNGVTQNITLPSTAFDITTDVDTFVTELNAAIDTAFGENILDVTHELDGSLKYMTKNSDGGVLPSLTVSISPLAPSFVFLDEGTESGLASTQSKLVSMVDLTADMTSPPSELVDITIGSDVFQMDVSTLDGSETPIRSSYFVELMKDAISGTTGNRLGDMADISIDALGELTIKAVAFGNLNIDEELNGFGIKGNAAIKVNFETIDGVVSGIASKGSYIKGPVDLMVDMRNPPSEKVNISIDGINYEVDVTGLNGTLVPIDKALFIERINGALSNPGDASITDVANIYFDSNDELVIESKEPGDIVMSEDLNGFGYNGVATTEASLSNSMLLITDADILAESAAILTNTFTFEVNGVTQNVVLNTIIPPAIVPPTAPTTVSEFLTILNDGIDFAFGADVLEVTNPGGSGGYLEFTTQGSVDGMIPEVTVSAVPGLTFMLDQEGSASGVEGSKSSFKMEINLEKDMRNEPSNISHITFNGEVYDVDVSGLDGESAPINKSVLLSRLQDAVLNPQPPQPLPPALPLPIVSFKDVASISYDISGNIVIEANDYGNVKMDEDLKWFGNKGNTVVEAKVSDPSKILGNQDIIDNAGELKDSVFMLTVNGVSKKVKIDSNTVFNDLTAVDDYVFALNIAIDKAFGEDVAEVTNNGGSIEFETKNTPEGIKPSISIDYTRTTESTLINDLNKFIVALKNGDTEGIDDYLGVVDSYTNNLLSLRADVGARTNRMELVSSRIAENTISFTRLLSDSQDADMSEVIMYLKNAENVYKASLSVGGRVIQPTLMDFLR